MKKQMFILEVNDTQDHSWQGQLKWIQGDSKQSFRSVIEMLRLIDSAVVGEEEAPDKQAEAGHDQSRRRRYRGFGRMTRCNRSRLRTRRNRYRSETDNTETGKIQEPDNRFKAGKAVS